MKQKELKTFYLRTYGCQMNELDSEIIVGQLERRGLTRLETEEDADLLIFNTCSIRDLAERNVKEALGGSLVTHALFMVLSRQRDIPTPVLLHFLPVPDPTDGRISAVTITGEVLAEPTTWTDVRHAWNARPSPWTCSKCGAVWHRRQLVAARNKTNRKTEAERDSEKTSNTPSG